MGRALRAPGFRRLLAARTISRWGDTFNAVAIVVLVYRLTGSGLRVATTVAFEVVPVLALGFLAGAVVDRLPRRRVMVAADLGRAAVVLSLVALQSHLWALYGAAFALSALRVFFEPAAGSVVPSLVDEGDVVAANSALWSAAVLSQVVLAPVAGALVVAAGAGPAFAIDALSFLTSACLLTGLRFPPRSGDPDVTRLGWSEVAAGFGFVRSSRFLSVLLAVQGMAALSAGATSALLVVLAARQLDAGPGRFGLMLAAIGVGAGLGPLVVQRAIRNPRRPGWLFGPYLLRGGVDLVLANSKSFGVALGALGAYGVGTSTGMVTHHSVLQTTVPDRLRGRVLSLFDVVWQASRLLSIAAGGALADAAGIGTVYLVGGLLLLAAGALGLSTRGRTDQCEQWRTSAA